MYDIYYQLFYRKGRTLLSVSLAVLLCSCMAFYMGNIRSNQEALDSLADTIPVVVRVVNRDASKENELNVKTELFDRLTHSPVQNIQCTALAAGALGKEARAQEPFIDGDVSIVAANSLDALEAPPETVTYAPLAWTAPYSNRLRESVQWIIRPMRKRTALNQAAPWTFPLIL